MNTPSSEAAKKRQDLWSGEPAVCFGWELSAVCADEPLSRHSLAAVQMGTTCAEGASQPALGALLSRLGRGDRLSIVHRLGQSTGSGLQYQVLVIGQADPSTAHDGSSQTVSLETEVRTALRLGYPQFGFRALLPDELTVDARSCPKSWVVLVGHLGGLQVRASNIGFLGRGALSQPVILPQRPEAAAAFLSGIPQALRSADQEITVTLGFNGTRLPPASENLVKDCIDHLEHTEWIAPPGWSAGPEDSSPAQGLTHDQRRAWEAWRLNPSGVTMSVQVASPSAVPSAVLKRIGHEVFQGRPFSFVGRSTLKETADLAPDELDLRSYLPGNAWLPALFPCPQSMMAAGVPLGTRLDDFEDNGPGVVLGKLPAGLGKYELQLADRDRSQHCYVIGATGTGKSTLLHSMIVQDIERGHGVALVDPHGDLIQKVLEHMPPARANDVVLLDFSDAEHIPGFNPLELKSEEKSLEANHVVRELAEILQQMYRNIPESLGPMFWLYMRNVLALLLLDPDADHTLLEVPRVLTDKTYRTHLVKHCPDDDVVDFWKGTALQATRDLALNEVAPYIINKFTEFTQNAFLRCVVGQTRSTFNMGEIMNQRQILLINLSKGLLNAADSSLLGMLLTSALFREAGKRARIPEDQRWPFNVYLDEFQNLTSDGLYSAMAECRKYGLGLTLSHQDGSQISPALKSNLRTNAASKIMFRLGFQDAAELGELTGPTFDASALSSLPDHHAIARIKSRRGMSPAIKLLTEQRYLIPMADSEEVQTHIVELSRRRYTTAKAAVKEMLAKSRRPVPAVASTDSDSSPQPVKKTNTYASLMQQAQELMGAADSRVTNE